MPPVRHIAHLGESLPNHGLTGLYTLLAPPVYAWCGFECGLKHVADQVLITQHIIATCMPGKQACLHCLFYSRIEHFVSD